MNEEESLNLLRRAFKTLKSQRPIPLIIEADAALLLFTQLQFVSRHPANTGDSAATAKAFALSLQEAVTKRFPEIGELLEKGWNPEFDHPPERSPETAPEQPVQRCTKFTELDLHFQTELLCNSLAFSYACQVIANKSGIPSEAIGAHFSQEAQAAVAQFSPEKIEEWAIETDRVREDADEYPGIFKFSF